MSLKGDKGASCFGNAQLHQYLSRENSKLLAAAVVVAVVSMAAAGGQVVAVY